MYRSFLVPFAIFGFLLLNAFSCCEVNYPPHQLGLFFDKSDTSQLFQTVYNPDYEKVVFEYPDFQETGQGDSLFIGLPLDQTSAQTRFWLYYQSGAVDTIIVEHQFSEQYNECDDYYYRFESGAVTVNTINNVKASSQSCCIQLELTW